VIEPLAVPAAAPPDTADGAPLRVALLGLGTVARPVAAHLVDATWRQGLLERGITPPELVAVGVRDPDRARGVTLPDSVRRTDDLGALARDPDVDVVVELIGGTELASEVTRAAVDTGKAVVTGNKALLAVHGAAIERAARASGSRIRFEAAVGGGIPVLGPLTTDLAADAIAAIRGIVNGTTNHILTAMARDARGYADVLAEAQSRGYAEADPTGDVEGDDAVHKLAILVRLAFGAWPDAALIRKATVDTAGDARPGITGVRSVDLSGAARLGLAIKLVVRAQRDAEGVVRAGVTPMAVRATSPLGTTDGVTNLIEVVADPVGRVSFRGPGAGGPATASAVLGDLLALARGRGSTWDGLLPAPPTHLPIADDLAADHSWMFVHPDAAIARGLGELEQHVLARDDDAVVVRPMSLAGIRGRLEALGIETVLYPVLAEA
jgi:homoserine dehydrogenase